MNLINDLWNIGWIILIIIGAISLLLLIAFTALTCWMSFIMDEVD